ncbi:MAG: hypothetical protein A2V79_00460 [Betaproteobacteria bacterium RBG_16_56_24]|nr:MAG: hypothetical protein A2V79_00460 [Betaproteobacteria bacterium RBG_16_56_24]
MKPGSKIKVCRSTVFAVLMGLTSLAYASVEAVPAEPPPPVKVDVFAQHSGGKISYHYRVFNNSQQDISGVSIGLDSRNDENPSNDIYELYELPSGWNLKFGIPSTSSSSPTGWRVNMTTPGMTTPEESSTHAITWEPLNENTPKLFAGQILVKMSVAVDKPDSNYLTGHARVTFTEGNPSNLTVPLESLDNTPPSITVNLSPNILRSPNNKSLSPESSRRAIAVHVSFTLKDDYDRKPEIKLESITASEPLEPDDIGDASFGFDDRYLLLRAEHRGDIDRIYTVTYSATDASGNQTLASSTVTVPHQQTGFK